MKNVDAHTERVLSLYSGGGGLDIGFRMAIPNARTVCYVEREISSVAVLVKAIENKYLDDAPIWSDSSTFDCEPWIGKVDWIIGGFPCQPWSVAGRREGKEDERWLWDDISKFIRTLRPKGIFLENVSGLITGHGIDTILGSLSEMGYDAKWGSIKAANVGATHRRERVFILAYKPSIGWRRWNERNERRCEQQIQTQGSFSKCSSELGNTERKGLERYSKHSSTISSERGKGKDSREYSSTGFAELDDTEHNGFNATEKQRGNGQAISGSQEGEDSTIQSEGTDNTSATQQGLENSNDSRFHRTQPDGAEREREKETEERENRSLSRSRGSSEDNELDDTNGESGGRQDGKCNAIKTGQNRYSMVQEEIPIFPPGPSNPIWADIIREYPELSPALEKSAFESDVRGMANGMASRLHRIDRLRILGNGVVPLQAAYALRTLIETIEK